MMDRYDLPALMRLSSRSCALGVQVHDVVLGGLALQFARRPEEGGMAIGYIRYGECLLVPVFGDCRR
jgi:hypothetical protein